MKSLLLAGALLLVLSGCATVGERALTAGTTGSVRFAAEDVDAAIAIAIQAQDTVAEACFRAIRKHVDVDQGAAVVKGIVSEYAAARGRIRESRAGLAPDVHVACSPLIVDAGTFASQLGLTLGGALAP